MDKISSELETIEQLLMKYGDTTRVNSVMEYRLLLEEDETLFWSKVDSLDWWGGSGSMADLHLNDESGAKSDHEQKADNRRFRTALISIYHSMVNTGRVNERAKFWVESFVKWQEQNL